MKKINNKEGILFWITGLAGSGKTTIARSIKKYIESEFGPTLILSGEDLRNILQSKKYAKKDRLKFSQQKRKFCKSILKQKINIIFSTISLFESVRKKNKREISNYIEIYIKSDLKKIIKLKKKKIYHKKSEKNIWGIDIKPEFPKNPDIQIRNNFYKNPRLLGKELRNKISQLLN